MTVNDADLPAAGFVYATPGDPLEVKLSLKDGFSLKDNKLEVLGADGVTVHTTITMTRDEVGKYYSSNFMMPEHDVSLRFATVKDAPASYSVTIVSPITNGSVTADKATAAEGETVTLTVTPDEGYELDELIVKDEGTNLVPATGTSFEMPAANVNVDATFKLKAVTPATYTVSFNPNSGDGTMPDITVNAGEKLTLPDCTFTPPSADK